MNYRISDRAIDILVVTAITVAIKALLPIPVSLLELMGLTNLPAMWLIGQIRLFCNMYPYEMGEVVPIYIYP